MDIFTVNIGVAAGHGGPITLLLPDDTESQHSHNIAVLSHNECQHLPCHVGLCLVTSNIVTEGVGHGLTIAAIIIDTARVDTSRGGSNAVCEDPSPGPAWQSGCLDPVVGGDNSVVENIEQVSWAGQAVSIVSGVLHQTDPAHLSSHPTGSDDRGGSHIVGRDGELRQTTHQAKQTQALQS